MLTEISINLANHWKKGVWADRQRPERGIVEYPTSQVKYMHITTIAICNKAKDGTGLIMAIITRKSSKRSLRRERRR